MDDGPNAATEVAHVVHAPSNPPAGRRENGASGIPTFLGPDKKLTISSPKAYWQPGWLKRTIA